MNDLELDQKFNNSPKGHKKEPEGNETIKDSVGQQNTSK